MIKSIRELLIIENDKTIFDIGMNFVIPLYQRAFAWEEKQLVQLIEDIDDVADGSKYYIGSLIVAREGDRYEVVDGQQRLTALYLLLSYLGYKIMPTLTFACREKSNFTLQHVNDLIEEKINKKDESNIESNIRYGLKIIAKEISQEGFDVEAFCEKLSRVVVYLIEVPEHTDLNRYFEIMNTRGEQLEQHDILKGILMSYLTSEEDRSLFTKIWDACSDMNGYVQMHFVSDHNEAREYLFGSYWSRFPYKDWEEYSDGLKADTVNGIKKSIEEITAIDFKIENVDGYNEDNVRIRFSSIIDFPFFLLHTLKVFIQINGIRHEKKEEKLVDEQLDDKKLLENFNRVLSHGIYLRSRIKNNPSEFVRDFALCLLRTRFLYDQYIIKREYTNENSDGQWSLKSLYATGKNDSKKPYYKNTEFVRKGEHGQKDKNRIRVKENMMLQSALRVSYTSPKVMHWITSLLIWLSENDYENYYSDDLSVFNGVIEGIATEAVREQFFEVCEEKYGKDCYPMGVNTPHIVFNYLDYLLWQKNPKEFNDFTFEFRNSVEHWYPRHPSEGTFKTWEDGVDNFGNLCIIQRNVNSRFSNMDPEAKKTTFQDMIKKASLKLRIMSEKTTPKDNKRASYHWKDSVYKEHEEEMIALLKARCYPKEE